MLREWLVTTLGPSLPDEVRGTSLDGKTLCNTLAAPERNVHLLSLLDQAWGGVLSQQAVDPTTNEAKAALDLLKTVVLQGRLVSGEAMFCQREICQQIVASGGDYLFVVKDNQPELKAAIEAEFQPGFPPATERQRQKLLSEARSSSNGHGRLVPRRLQASTRLADHLDGPGLLPLATHHDLSGPEDGRGAVCD